MRTLAAFSITILLTLLFTMLEPWWLIALASFIPCLILVNKLSYGFIIGFFSVFFCWFISTYIINYLNDGILAAKIASIIGVQKPLILMIISSIAGAIIAGLGGMLGASLHGVVMRPRKPKNKYI